MRKDKRPLTMGGDMGWQVRKGISQLAISKAIEIPFTPESNPLAENEQRNCLTLVEAGFRARL